MPDAQTRRPELLSVAKLKDIDDDLVICRMEEDVSDCDTDSDSDSDSETTGDI